nr:MAG TPA: hypothetical protein [Caudoviricetes sp.]
MILSQLPLHNRTQFITRNCASNITHKITLSTTHNRQCFSCIQQTL